MLRQLPVCAVLVIASAASAKDAPARAKPRPPAQAAAQVVAAVSADDAPALKALAQATRPDPWRVADLLCAQGAFDAARAFATAAPRKAIERLPAYVAAMRAGTDSGPARKALAAIVSAAGKGDWARVLSLAENAGEAKDVPGLRVARGHAQALDKLGRREEAVAQHRKTSQAALALGWLRHARQGFHDLAVLSFRQRQWAAAIEGWQACVQIDQDLGSRQQAGEALSYLAMAQDRAGRTDEALASLARALAEAQAVESKLGELQVLSATAAIHARREELDKAIDAYQRGVVIAEAIGHQKQLAVCLGNLGALLERKGRVDEALAAYQRVRTIGEAVQRKDFVLSATNNIAGIQNRRGDYPGALKTYAQARALAEAARNQVMLAMILTNTAHVRSEMGAYDLALQDVDAAVKLAESMQHRERLTNALRTRGNILEHLGEHRQALAALGRALEIARALGLRGAIATTLQGMARVHQTQGALSKALEYHTRALEIFQAIGDVGGIAYSFNNIGNLHLALGALDEAATALERALAIQKSASDRLGILFALNNLGMVELRQGAYAAARDRFAQSLAIARALAHPRAEMGSLIRRGMAEQRLKQHAQALATYGEMMEVARKLGDFEHVAAAKRNAGELQRTLGDRDAAYASFVEALALAEADTAPGTRLGLLWSLARLELDRGEHADAMRHAREAIDLLGRRVTGLGDELGAIARERYDSVFSVGLSAAVAAGSAEDVAYFLEAGRAGSLLESLGGRDALRGIVIPRALRVAEREAAADERRTAKALGEARTRGNRRETRKFRKAHRAAREALQAIVARIRRATKAGALLVYPEPDDLDVIAATLEPREALVVYGLTTDRAVALVVRKTTRRVIELAPSSRVDEAVGALLREQHPYVDPDKAGALRELLVDPLGLAHDVTRVLVCPSGRLGYVPFALLLPDKELAYVPSGSAYRVLRDDRARRGQGVLAVGDPAYPQGPLARLPATRAEVEQVGTVKLLGAQATETAVRAAIGKQARWQAVHFACHGLVDPERPLRSSLALTPEGSEDGFLNCLEVFATPMPADLVVLSACETGKGKIYNTEGIVGLTRAFMFAGAPRVICSLWKVDDAATQALMVKFYELWNGDARMPAAEALRQAQAHVRAQAKWSHPVYWAAWVLWGLPE